MHDDRLSLASGGIERLDCCRGAILVDALGGQADLDPFIPEYREIGLLLRSEFFYFLDHLLPLEINGFGSGGYAALSRAGRKASGTNSSLEIPVNSETSGRYSTGTFFHWEIVEGCKFRCSASLACIPRFDLKNSLSFSIATIFSQNEIQSSKKFQSGAMECIFLLSEN
jgi:hypothetical protein